MENALLKKATVRKRLKSLKESYANLAIEDMRVAPPLKKFLEGMVKEGLTQEQMTEKVNLRFKNG